jgi:hypothetical protein
MEWVSDLIDDQERARLAQVARGSLETLSHEWKRPGTAAAGIAADELCQLGWMDPDIYRTKALKAVEESVVRPLQRFGILV